MYKLKIDQTYINHSLSIYSLYNYQLTESTRQIIHPVLVFFILSSERNYLLQRLFNLSESSISIINIQVMNITHADLLLLLVNR